MTLNDQTNLMIAAVAGVIVLILVGVALAYWRVTLLLASAFVSLVIGIAIIKIAFQIVF